MLKKFMSILMSFAMIATITAGIDMSTYASEEETAVFVPVQLNSISTKLFNSAGVHSISSSSSFNPLANEYIIDAQSSQFDFFENYSSVENLKAWANGKNADGEWVSFNPNKDIYDIYAQKLGIVTKNLSDYEKVAKIYNFMSKTLGSSGAETVLSNTLLISRSGHCEAFSDIFCELCKRANIENWLIASTGHVWNIVKVDGKYYECDPMNDRRFLCNLQDVIDANVAENLYLEITDFEREERYEGIDAVKRWAKKYNSAVSTEDYSLPEETITLPMPKTTATATSEGVVVKWDPVANADWYEVYYVGVDGITDKASQMKKNPTTNKWETVNYETGGYVYFKRGLGCPNTNNDGNLSFKKAGSMTSSTSNVVHSVDKNEQGQYQFYIDPEIVSLTDYGAMVLVVAKDVNGKTSIPAREINDKTVANIGATEYVINTTTLEDKNTGKTVSNATILKINESNLVINNDYDARNHGFSNKVATPITAGIGTQGAEVYECPDCLQRKMVYTKALPCTAHKYETTTAKATTKKNGSVVTKCSICNKKQSTTTIYSPKTITLSTTSYVYNSKAQKPSVTVKDSKGRALKNGTDYTVSYSNNKNVGKASAKITFKGNYSGTVTKTFTIKPKSTSISKLTAGKKKFTVKWKKQSTQTTGYEIQYATDSKFTKNKKTVTVGKNSTTSKTISKLSAKKKYFVRIRTYKMVNGKKYYSAWSNSKTVTTKK